MLIGFNYKHAEVYKTSSILVSSNKIESVLSLYNRIHFKLYN